MKTRTVKIVSDGTLSGSSIKIADNGKVIPMVDRAIITIDAHDSKVCTAFIHILQPEVELLAEARLENKWPPPEWLMKIFRAWQLWSGTERIEPTVAERQHIHNLAEFARFGLQRIN